MQISFRLNALVWILSCASVFGSANLFRELDQTFWTAQSPVHERHLGYWAGRCVHADDPNTVWPAIYLYKQVNNPNHFPPSYYSQTYFSEKNKNPFLFDKMKPAEINIHPTIKEWFQKEQWQKVQELERSYVNFFDYPEKITIRRSSRVYKDNLNRMPILRVTRWKGPVYEGVTTLCFFPYFLGKP